VKKKPSVTISSKTTTLKSKPAIGDKKSTQDALKEEKEDPSAHWTPF